MAHESPEGDIYGPFTAFKMVRPTVCVFNFFRPFPEASA